MSERYFDSAGKDLMKIGIAIAKRQKLARLLVYPDGTPLSSDKPEVDGYSLIDKNIIFIPTIEDDETVTESTVMILLDRFWMNKGNPAFKGMRIRINVICPVRSWVINDRSLRPLMILSEIDKALNGSRFAGIGTLQLDDTNRLVISRHLAGYVVDYVCDTFN